MAKSSAAAPEVPPANTAPEAAAKAGSADVTWSEDVAPILFEHTRCGKEFEPELCCSECGEPVPPWEVRARVRPELPGLPPVVRGPIREDSGS